MKKCTFENAFAQGAKQQNNTELQGICNDNPEALISPNLLDFERECPISYQVTLFIYRFGSEENFDLKIGHRISQLFYNADPLEARKDAVIYATGLNTLVENEYRYGGLNYDSPSTAECKGHRNINLYSISVNLIRGENDEETLLLYNSGVLDPSNETLNNLEEEFQLLQSLGYMVDRFFKVADNKGEIFHCINSKVDFVKYDGGHPLELFKRYAA